MKLKIARIINTTKRIFANSVALAAIAPNPNTPATRANIKNVNAQLSIKSPKVVLL